MRDGNDKRSIHAYSKKEFELKLRRAKHDTKKLSEKRLDVLLLKEWKKGTRLHAYDDADAWYMGIADIREVGVWKRAGGLPKAWTNGPLTLTAKKVAGVLSKGGRMRALRAIPRIIATSLSFVEKDPYLFPIVLTGGTGTMGRKGLKK